VFLVENKKEKRRESVTQHTATERKKEKERKRKESKKEREIKNTGSDSFYERDPIGSAAFFSDARRVTPRHQALQHRSTFPPHTSHRAGRRFFYAIRSATRLNHFVLFPHL
jgi:hypothetical protein